LPRGFKGPPLPRAARLYPKVANLCRGKTRQGVPDVVARSLGQAEAYLTVRDVLLLARAQMAFSGASLAVLAGSGLQL